jgi:glycosyltransferase involved in cell wall biosynthesis
MQEAEKFYQINDKIQCFENLSKPFNNGFRGKIRRALGLITFIRTSIKTFKPDILLCMISTTTFWGIISTLFTKTKVIGTERANPYISLKGSIWQKIIWIFSILTDGFIFQTTDASKFYPKSVRKKGCIIANMIEPPPVNFTYNFESKKIVAVGTLRPVKGFDVLINAMSKLPKRLNDYCLYIYGGQATLEPEYQKELQNLINEKGLNNSVKLAGKSKDILSSINDACLFVLSSHNEGMPNALMEAMSIGLPCISTDCDFGPRDIIENNINGILVPVNNSTILANQIISLLDQNELRKKLSENAKKVNIKFSINKIGVQWIDYLHKTLRK